MGANDGFLGDRHVLMGVIKSFSQRSGEREGKGEG